MTVTEYIMGWNAAAVICLIAGLLLMACEIFTPGMGAPAVLGGVCLLAAVILRADSLMTALVTLLLILIPLIIAAAIVFRSFSKGMLSRSRMVLHDRVDGSSTPLTGREMQALTGAEGVARTALRPAGSGDFGGRRLDVVSEGEFIEKGARLRITRIDGIKIMVREI